MAILVDHILTVVGVRMRQQKREAVDAHSQLNAEEPPATCFNQGQREGELPQDCDQFRAVSVQKRPGPAVTG